MNWIESNRAAGKIERRKNLFRVAIETLSSLEAKFPHQREQNSLKLPLLPFSFLSQRERERERRFACDEREGDEKKMFPR